MTANNSTLDPIPAPSPENTEQLGFTVGVGPDQTVTTRPACRRWGHYKPSHLDLPTPVVGPNRPPTRGQIRLSGPDEHTELVRLRREVAELRRANEILRTASAFFAAAELDRRLK